MARGLWVGVLLLLGGAPALAADTWTAIRPGVDRLHRTGGGQDIWALRVNLASPNVGLRVTADVAGERGVNTLTFARNTGVLAAINGDWSDGRTPVGLAISDGNLWHRHIQSPHGWGYFACTVDSRCVIDQAPPLDEAWWFGDPTLPPNRFFQAVGTNGLLLLQGGQRLQGCYDGARNPRSAVCLEADGAHLWMVVVDGRRAGAAGMTCDETRDLLLGFGCHDAAMLDGGGSSTLVVEGQVQNRPSDGSPRVVSNHLGITWTDAPDGRCPAPDTRFCRGNIIATCQGGRFLGEGDCAAFGAACEADGAYAYCVHPFCPDGHGQGADCTGETTFRSCNDGRLDEQDGDCGAFGLVCGEDAAGRARCMDRRCQAGPGGAFCLDGARRAACVDGAYAESACPAGQRCRDGACAAPPPMDAAPPPQPPEDAAPPAPPMIDAEAPPARPDAGATPDPHDATPSHAPQDATPADAEADADPLAPPSVRLDGTLGPAIGPGRDDDPTPLGAQNSGDGCAATPPAGAPVLLALFLLGLRRRRR
ncbi:MAG: phosphodiester glycosidase family protein [Myxococcales bacterium]|nr:phosphodiester glycosidase family protein [Myxococcales bacterium]